MIAITLIGTGCLESSTGPAVDDTVRSNAWEAFSVARMQAERERQELSFLTVLDEKNFRMGLFHASVGADLGLSTHPLNALYYVVDGEATIATETEEHDVSRGSVVFVRGNVEHRIRGIREDLEMVVIFRVASLAAFDPEIDVLRTADAFMAPDPEGPAFRAMMSTSTLAVGAYMLPKGFEGDQLMTHTIDELKIVVNGGARFDIGQGGFDGQPGSIAYIQANVPHRFRRISDAIDVLVVWQR